MVKEFLSDCMDWLCYAAEWLVIAVLLCVWLEMVTIYREGLPAETTAVQSQGR
jgi:hypothetical protein